MPELKLENSLVDNRYEVVERLNRGSFAEIFVARDREAGGMEVVLKALNTSLQGTPDAELERTLIENFQNEAVALDTVRHPHVILRWGHGAAADLRGTPFYYLSLEYMPGGDLLQLCRARPGAALPLDEALFYFKQACEALAYAHDNGIIHRDLKPNNFLLSADHRTLKIADFGVAKIATGEDNEITRVGADIYAPPEHHPGEMPVARASARLTASADIYSLAKSFYTIVCGRPPSQYKCDPITSMPADSISESVRRRLVGVLRRATDDNPSARYASVVEFWSDLAQVTSAVEEEKADATPDDADDTTIVRPRLNVDPGSLPGSPAQPDFDPALASARQQVKVTTARLVEKPRAVQSAPNLLAFEDNDIHQAQPALKLKPGDRSSKFFIELQENKRAPAVQTQVVSEPPATRADSKAQAKAESPEKAKPPEKTEPVTSKRAKKAADKFNRKVRRNIFIGLFIFATLGAIVKVDRYVRSQDAPFGFGPPSKIEVVVDGLNVRLAPSSSREREKVLGTVARGSQHEVLEQRDNNWILIRVGSWATKEPNVETDRGWIYGDLDGNPANVRVVSRKFWQ
jgi:serine/threonine protein kinase